MMLISTIHLRVKILRLRELTYVSHKMLCEFHASGPEVREAQGQDHMSQDAAIQSYSEGGSLKVAGYHEVLERMS